MMITVRRKNIRKSQNIATACNALRYVISKIYGLLDFRFIVNNQENTHVCCNSIIVYIYNYPLFLFSHV